MSKTQERISELLRSGAFFTACAQPGQRDRPVRIFDHNGDFFSDRTGARFIVAPWDDQTRDSVPVILNQSDYHQLIDEAIRTMRSGRFQKVVLSRIIPVERHAASVALDQLFTRICQTYPKAFCYVLNHPDFGLWLGATPEILVEVSGQNLHTMALAGTRKSSGGEAEWGNKELDEHAFVVREICDRLAPHGLPEVGTRLTAKAGPVEHILTPIHLKGIFSLNQMAAELHPTPAVCGWPRKEAHEFIHLHEPHSRELYTGYLGIVEANGEGACYVNLRCMKVEEHRYLLYAGGGITIDSEAQAEWQETSNKAETLLSVMREKSQRI